MQCAEGALQTSMGIWIHSVPGWANYNGTYRHPEVCTFVFPIFSSFQHQNEYWFLSVFVLFCVLFIPKKCCCLFRSFTTTKHWLTLQFYITVKTNSPANVCCRNSILPYNTFNSLIPLLRYFWYIYLYRAVCCHKFLGSHGSHRPNFWQFSHRGLWYSVCKNKQTKTVCNKV